MKLKRTATPHEEAEKLSSVTSSALFGNGNVESRWVAGWLVFMSANVKLSGSPASGETRSNAGWGEVFTFEGIFGWFAVGAPLE